jgi:hypothetical protein
MSKKGYKTTSIDIKMELYLLLASREINISALFNKIASGLFELPEDPNEKLIREKSQYIVLQLRENYEKEIKILMAEHAEQSKQSELEKQKEQELIQFGGWLQGTSVYPAFQSQLARKDFEDDTLLAKVTTEINRLNGKRYEMVDVWNRAICWYQKYGATP